MAEETNTTITSTSQNAQNASQTAQTTSTTVNSTTGQNGDKTTQNVSNTPSIEELIQKAVDQATNKLGNDNKRLRESLQKLQNEKLTDDEKKNLELEEKERNLADREAKLQEKINREFALKSIKEAGLDDGGSNSLELIDFVVCNNEKDTLNRVKAFGELVNKFVKAEVDKTFKQHGRNPNSSVGDDSQGTSSVAEQLGKTRAEMAKKSNDTLSYYLGGK